MLRDYFSFSRSEIRALAVLVPVAVLLAVLLIVRDGRRHDALMSETVTPAPEQPAAKPAKTALQSDSTLFSFNPNTADSSALRLLGLSQRVTTNIVKYRRAGGRFRHKEDLARIYGMDSTSFALLKPYICIPDEQTKTTAKNLRADTRHQVADTLPATNILSGDTFPTLQPRKENPYRDYMANKLHEGEFLDLNRADTADLKRIPGIGSYYAAAIVNYRRQLGGYVSLSQLQELGERYDIDNLPENIGDWFTLEPGTCHTIDVNKATLKQLKEHPYIGYYRAKAIMDLRKSEGKIINLRQLSFLDAFSAEDITRLEPYLTF